MGNFFQENKSLFTLMGELMAIASAIGFIVGSFIIYRYFDINNLALQPSDTFTILTISFSFLVLIGSFSTILIFSSVYIYVSLDRLKDKGEILKLLKIGIFRVGIFWGIFLLYALMNPTLSNPWYLLVLVPVAILLVWSGTKYSYPENKFSEDYSIGSLMSLDFILMQVPLVVLSTLFIVTDKTSFESLMLMFVVALGFFALPYLYHLSFQNAKSNIIPILIMLIIAMFILFSLGSSFFAERAIQVLHVGGKPYNKLIIDKSECNKLKEYKNLGYQCDENSTLYDMYGVWIVGEKPIFQKAKKGNNSQGLQLDRNSTKIWFNRDKILTVL